MWNILRNRVLPAILMIIFSFLLLISVYKGQQGIIVHNEIIEYNTQTEIFETISANELRKKINENESLLLYTGRATCPFCRKLIAKLNKNFDELKPLLAKKDIHFYYLNSENTELNFEIKTFREKYQIDEVPSIMFFNKNNSYHIDLEYNDDTFNIENLQNILTNNGGGKKI